MDYETSKRRCKQTFNGILQLTFYIGFLQEVSALNKERFHFSGKGSAGRVEHPQARSRLDGLVCDIISAKDNRTKANIDKERVYMLWRT